jgi:hypothetical protein
LTNFSCSGGGSKSAVYCVEDLILKFFFCTMAGGLEKRWRASGQQGLVL